MNTLNFLNMIYFNNPKILERKNNQLLISFETILFNDDEEYLKGETCFLFCLDDNRVYKWIHKVIDFKEGILFVDPLFTNNLHHFLRSKNFDLNSSHPLEEFLKTQMMKIPSVSLLKCFINPNIK